MQTPKGIADQIDGMIATICHDFSAEEMQEVGHAAVNMIVLRTKSGKDADLQPFKSYSKAYLKERSQHGLSAQPDLARSGHMLGSIVPQSSQNETVLKFLAARDELKAAVHNYGVDTQTSVRSHRRSTVVNSKTGQRVSSKEAALDKRRKNKRTVTRYENVSTFTRHQRTPQREFFDIRHPHETDAVQEQFGRVITARADKLK